ncbi:MAG: PorV/PorQ family protein [bacterium]
MKIKAIFLIISLLMQMRILYASDVGVTGAQFLKIGTGARPMGMGGAFSAVADDGYAAYWNPAGFAQIQKPELATTYLKYFQDIDFGYMGYVLPYKSGVYGVGITYLTLGDIEGRTGDSEQPDRKFGASDICAEVSYAIKEPFDVALPGVDMGLNLKYIQQEIDGNKAQTGALDLGSLYHTVYKPLTIAICLQNVGPGNKFVKVRDPLPLNLKLGCAYRMLQNKLITSLDIDQYLIDQKMYAGFGAEYWMIDIIALRAGYRYGYHKNSLGNIVGLSGGLSLKAFNFQLDYAFVPFGKLGDTHRFSLSAKF